MNTFASPKLPAYIALAVTGCSTGLVLRRAEPVLLAAPFLVALGIGLALAQMPRIRAVVNLTREQALEGEDVEVEVMLEATAPVARAEIVLRLPPGLEEDGGALVHARSLTTTAPQRMRRVIHCRRWGGYAVGELYVRARDTFGFFVTEVHFHPQCPLRVYPLPAALRSIIRASETQVFVGNELSRAKGDGIEFIDVRPFAPGDRVRRVNWRLSTRRRELYVNEFQREQNTDIILFLDTFAEARHGNNGTLDEAIRATAALAERYLQRRDRVGLIGFGGILRWLRPAMGLAQYYQIVEALIDTEVVVSFAWKGIDVIPPATLPPKALLVAITPLLDERTINALFDLRARRFDLAIIEVSPIPFVAQPARPAKDIAIHVWALERELLRDRFRRLGVPIGAWEASQALDAVVQEVQAFRRSARRARA